PVAQWIERLPPEQEVTCSNPVGRAPATSRRLLPGFWYTPPGRDPSTISGRVAPRILTLTAGISLMLACAQPAAAATYPAGFSQVTLASGLSGAVAVDWAPDGRMFVAERSGVVKVVDPDGTKRTLLDISDHVNNWGDRGLLGVAVDSHFAQYPYLYLYYTYDADPSRREADKTG